MYVVHDADLAEAEATGVNEVFPPERLGIMKARCASLFVDFVEAPLPVRAPSKVSVEAPSKANTKSN